MDIFVNSFGEIDPAAEFLAREQNQLGELENELFFPNNSTQISAQQTNDSSTPHFLSEDKKTNNFAVISGNDNDFDIVDDVCKNISVEKSIDIVQNHIVTSEKILKWQENQKILLQKKDEEERQKIEELREQGKRELEEWYKHHREQINSVKSTIRNEDQCINDQANTSSGNDWEKISKLCDFNSKSSRGTKDVSRMRSIILQLKQTPLAGR